MFKPFLIVPMLILLPAFCQETQPANPPPPPAPLSAVPSDWAGKTNPVKPTPESQSRAKKIYGWDCAMCHGDNGDGKGDVAADQKLAMRDFHESLKGMSDGEIFYIIQKGKGPMPSDGDRAKPDEIWNLVIYLRKMANATATASAAPPA